VKQEENLLAPTKIELSSKYKLEDDTNTGSTLSPHSFLPFTLSPLSLLLPLSTTLPLLYSMSQYNSTNYELLVQQQQEQLIILQAQLQALLAAQKGEVASKIEASAKKIKLQVFNRSSEKVSGFIIACKLYIRMKMRGDPVEEQIQ